MTADAVQTPSAAGRDTPQCDVTCECFTDFGQLRRLSDDWDRFVERAGGDVYFSYDWCRIWWRHYAYRRRLRIFVFRAAGELVGIMPMFTDRLWLGPVSLRLAKFIGSDSTLAVLSPPVASHRSGEVYAELLRQLLEVERCDAVVFGPLCGDGPHAGAIRAACRAAPGPRLVRDQVTGVHNIYRLPGDCEAYLRGLGKTARHDYERGWRRLMAEHPVAAETINGEEALGAYDEFVRLHTEQWRRCRRLGHFGDWPGATEFNRDLVRALAPLNRAGFHNLRADGNVVSSAYFLRFGANEHWRLSARDLGQQWSRVHLGILVQVRAVEAAIRAGVRRVDDGPGRYEYKTAMGAQEYPVRSLLVAHSVGGRLKLALLGRLSGLMHLLYYRVWFGRIAPRLPLRRRSLRVLWTRYHV